MKIRLLLADSRRLIHDGICALLEPQNEIKVVGAAEEGPAAVKLAEALAPDVAVVDLHPSPSGACGSVRRVRRVSPRIGHVSLMASLSPGLTRQVLGGGYEVCLAKAWPWSELFSA